mgnify:CR=1 FL=1
MRPLLILKTGSTLSHTAARLGDFEDWIIRDLDLPASSIIVVCPFWPDRLPAPENFSGVILTGSHAMLTRNLPWMRQTAHWLTLIPGSSIPALGICFGHHLLAFALGGEVRAHPRGPEVGTVRVETTPAARHDPLLHDLGPIFSVHAAHTQSAIRLPPKADLLAKNAWEPHHAFRYGDYIWGLQFHPEFSRGAVLDYMAWQQETTINGADRCPGDPAAAEANGPTILRRFASFVVNTERTWSGQD